MSYRIPSGTRDILPDEASRWQYVEASAREHLHRYGFREIRTPVLVNGRLIFGAVDDQVLSLIHI